MDLARDVFTTHSEEPILVTTSLMMALTDYTDYPPPPAKSEGNPSCPEEQKNQADGSTLGGHNHVLQAVIKRKGYNLDQQSRPKGIAKATKDGQEVALKFLGSAMDELQILEYLQTCKPTPKYVIKLLDVITSDINNVIVMPWLTPLDTFLKMCPGMAQPLWTQFLEGVRFLHENKVAHLDLKPENALVSPPDLSSSPHLSIIDFGLSVRVKNEGTQVKGYRGTPSWSAPEVGPDENGPRLLYSAILADRWSCGKVLHYICTFFCTPDPVVDHACAKLLSLCPSGRPPLGDLLSSQEEGTTERSVRTEEVHVTAQKQPYTISGPGWYVPTFSPSCVQPQASGPGGQANKYAKTL
jgi:serine/threonine protein kinase